jgi:tellurite methyltransferase
VTLMLTPQEQFGQIDIYLFDQILKGRIPPGTRIIDAGCGYGRNLTYFSRGDYELYGVDENAEAIAQIRRALPSVPAAHFRVESIELMSFPDGFADVVLSSAVLHFARDDQHFLKMFNAMWRVLKPGGFLFCRLASSIGIEGKIEHIDGRRYLLPDGSERYLVDENLLMNLTHSAGGTLLDPLKTTVVSNQRSMTTWVVVKNR